MKVIFNISKIGFWATCICLISLNTLSSCKDDFPDNVESDKITVLKSIKIVNAGKSGNEIIEGVVNENTKTVSFPRIDPETDLSAITVLVQVDRHIIAMTDPGATNFADINICHCLRCRSRICPMVDFYWTCSTGTR